MPTTTTTANRGHLCRAAFATFLAAARADHCADADAHAKRRWRDDSATPTLLRAAASPASVADQAGLLSGAVVDFLKGLPVSAAAKLMAKSLSVRLTGDRVSIPYGDTDGAMSWVAEGDPIPVTQGATGSLSLLARKMGVIVTCSRELWRQADAERILRHMLTREASLAFDRALFSADAGDDTRVAGALNGVTPIAGTQFGGDLGEVLGVLASSIAEAGGSGDLFVAAAPALAARIAIQFPALPYQVAATRALPAGSIVAVDAQAVAFATGDEIDIEATQSALLHMNDDPLPIVGGATSDPVVEMFQTAAVAVRLILDVGFAARPGAVQLIEGVV